MCIRYVLVLLCAILFITQPALAQQRERDCSGAATANGRDNLVVFINGILNTRPQSDCALEALRDLVDVEAEQSDFKLFYNPTNGFVQDVAELRFEAEISDRARDIAQNDSTILVRGESARYNYVLGKLYIERFKNGVYENDAEEEVITRANELYAELKRQVQNGRSITVVAHSQGNFYIEAAIAIMRYRGEADIANKIHVVGVAPVSSTTPNGVYFSLKEDKALDWQRTQTADLKFFKVLPSNASGGIGATVSAQSTSPFVLGGMDGNVHSFEKIYLNQFVMVDDISIGDRIRDQVVRSRDGMKFGWEAKSEIETTKVKPEVKTVTQSTLKSIPFAVMYAASGISNNFSMMFGIGSNKEVIKHFWDFGDGSVSSRGSNSSTVNIFDSPGVYKVTLTRTFNDGSITICTRTFIMDETFKDRHYDSRGRQTACE